MLLLFLFYDYIEMGIKTHLEIIKCSMRAVFKFRSQGKVTFALRKDLKVLEDTVCSLKGDPCGSSGSKVPILPDSTTVHYPPYTTVCCIVVAIYSLHVEVNPSF